MNHNRLLILLMAFLALLFLLLAIDFEGKVGDFGLNGFSEVVGIAVTVVIVERLLKQQEIRRNLPQKATAYVDVVTLVNEVIWFWSNATRLSIRKDGPEDVRQLFTEDAFRQLEMSLNLDSEPNITPPRKWWAWLPQQIAEHKNFCGTILERHNAALDPIAYQLVHHIATSSPNTDALLMIRRHDIESGFPRPQVLAAYWYRPDGYLEAIVGLIDWCRTAHADLLRNKMINLREVSAPTRWKALENPPCMLSQEELDRQGAAVDAYRNRN